MKKTTILFTVFITMVALNINAQETSEKDFKSGGGFTTGYQNIYDPTRSNNENCFTFTGEGYSVFLESLIIGGFGKVIVNDSLSIGDGGLLLGYRNRSEKMVFDLISYTGFGGGIYNGNPVATVDEEIKFRFTFPVKDLMLIGISPGLGYFGSLSPKTYELNAIQASISFILNFE